LNQYESNLPNTQYDFKVLYTKIQPLVELHSELDKVIKRLAKFQTSLRAAKMSIVTKLKTHGTIQTLIRSGCATKPQQQEQCK